MYRTFRVVIALLIVMFAAAMCSPHPLTRETKPFWDRDNQPLLFQRFSLDIMTYAILPNIIL
jgi:hypothetical protein